MMTQQDDKHKPDKEEELKKKIQELQDLNRNLEVKIAEEVEKNRKQEQVIMQQAKLAAMGQMVTAIAHQWRQPLTSVGFIVQNIKSAYELGKLDETYINEAANEAMEQIQSMSETIDELGDFLKPLKEKIEFDVITAISETLSMVHTQIQNNSIQVRFNKKNLTSLPVTIVGFPNEFKQVLLNIINNGIYAIKKKIEKGNLEEGKGEIIVEVELESAEEEGAGLQLVIKVSNNGLPIPEQVLGRIFEPFYTTREDIKGKGVGLYMAKIIIERNMGGKIDARNIKGRVVFIIRFHHNPAPAPGEHPNENH
jgi:signal transduction histidine kinase